MLLLLLLCSLASPAASLSRDRFLELSIRGLYPDIAPLAEFSLSSLLPCSNSTWAFSPAVRTLSPSGAPALCLDVGLAAPSPEGGVTGAPPYAGAPAQLRPCNASSPTQLWTASSGGATLTSDASYLGAPLCLAPLSDGSGAVGVLLCSAAGGTAAWSVTGPAGAWLLGAAAAPGLCLAPGGRSLQAQAAFVVGRLAPLLAPTSGLTGLIVDLGWLVDLVVDYTGSPQQPYPIATNMAPQWAGTTYADIARLLGSLRAAGRDAGLSLSLGTLCVGWASIYQIPTSPFSLRHPEVYWQGHGYGPPLHFPAAASPGLLADSYPYAAYPRGLPLNTSFFALFGAQWAAVAPALGLDALVVRDGLTSWSDYGPRWGPLGYAASPDPALNAPWLAAQGAIFQAVKQALPSTLVLGYSSAASAVAEVRVGLFDLEGVVAAGWIDGWIDQSWAGAWQDVPDRHNVMLGWTMQLHYILAHRAAIAGGNAARAAAGRPPCRHYVLSDTFDSYEIWSTIRDVPGKLAWGIWAYHTAALRTLSPSGQETLTAADGAYISWAWSWQQDWLTPANVTWLAAHLGAAQAAGEALQAVYGPAILYNRAALLHMQAHAPAGTIGEWVDEQAGLLAKFGLGVHSVQRADAPGPVLAAGRGDGYLLHAPLALPPAAAAAVGAAAAAGCPLLLLGAAAALDAAVLAAAGVVALAPPPPPASAAGLPLGFYPATLSPAAAALAPGLPGLAVLSLVNATPVALLPGAVALLTLGPSGGNATVLTQKGSVLWWHPSDRQTPGGSVENADLTVANVGSLAPHALLAAALGALHAQRNVSRLAPGSVNASTSAALTLLRSGGSLKVLAGNLESLNTGAGAPALPSCSRSPRQPRLLLRLDHVGVPAGRRVAGGCWVLTDVVPVDGSGQPIVGHADASGDEVAFDIYLPPHGGRALELSDCSGAVA